METRTKIKKALPITMNHGRFMDTRRHHHRFPSILKV